MSDNKVAVIIFGLVAIFIIIGVIPDLLSTFGSHLENVDESRLENVDELQWVKLGLVLLVVVLIIILLGVIKLW